MAERNGLLNRRTGYTVPWVRIPPSPQKFSICPQSVIFEGILYSNCSNLFRVLRNPSLIDYFPINKGFGIPSPIFYFLTETNVYRKKNALLNPKREPLMPEKLRELSGLNLSDEQAKEVIWSLTKYVQIIHDFTIQQERVDK